MENCSFIKTVLMVFVIIDHSCRFWTEHWFSVYTPVRKAPFLAMLSSWLGTFHTYAFTLVSGYIFKFKIDQGDYNSYLSFINKKIKRLLIPYWFTMIIWVAPLTAFFLHLNAYDIFKKYILCINPSQLWFLWMLFDVFAIAWPLWRKAETNPFQAWVFVILLYALGVIGDLFLPNIFCIWRACKYTLVFYLGIQIRLSIDKKEWESVYRVPGSVLIALDLLAFAGFYYACNHKGLKWQVLQYVLSLFLNCLGAIIAFIVLQKASILIPWNKNKYFTYLSRHSMTIYLFHQQLVFISIIMLNGLVVPWINASINFVFALAGSVLITSIMMRFKVTRVLIGEG